MKKLFSAAATFFAVSVMLFGCMASVETRPEVVAQAKAFAPMKGKAVVYAIRDTSTFANESISAYIKEKGDDSGYAVPITLLPQSFGRAEVKPGSYQLYANPVTYSLFDAAPTKDVRLKAGDVVIYRLAPKRSWSGTVFVMDKLSKKQALSLINKHQLALVR